MHIHVSNLDSQLTNDDLKNIFLPYGEVASAEIAIDAFTDKPRGFGLVEMPNDEQATAAVTALNKSEVAGKLLEVKETEPPKVQKGSYKVGNGPVTVYKFRKNK